jgi:hypothetical protein
MRRFTPRAASPAIDNYQFADVADRAPKSGETVVSDDVKLGALRRSLAMPVECLQEVRAGFDGIG